MSVKSSAKPIVRRRRVDSTRRPNVPTLLSVPDLRVLTDVDAQEQIDVDEPSATDDVAELGIQDIPDQIEDVDVVSLNSVQPEAASFDEGTDSLEGIQSVDLSRPRTEFGIAPPRAVIGSAAAVETASTETPDFSGEEQKPARKKRTKSTEPVSVAEPKTPLGEEVFSKNFKNNLSVLGTIAAAIFACTLVASAMRDDGGSDNPNLAVNSTELIDQLPTDGEVLQPEVVAEVAPQFDPAELQASVQRGGPSPFSRPLGQVTEQPQTLQSQGVQSQAINRVAMQPGTDREQRKVDPFALQGFGGQETRIDAHAESRQTSGAANAQGIGQAGLVQPAFAQPQPQPSEQRTGPVFAAPQNSVQRQDFSANSNARTLPLPAVPNRFGQGNATTAYPTTSQNYQPFNQLKATLEQGPPSRLGDTRGGQFGTQQVPQFNSGPVFNNNGGVNR